MNPPSSPGAGQPGKLLQGSDPQKPCEIPNVCCFKPVELGLDNMKNGSDCKKCFMLKYLDVMRQLPSSGLENILVFCITFISL